MSITVKVLKTVGLYNQVRTIRDARLRNKRVAFYSKFINKGDLCFDVGANIGNRTDIFLRLGAKVVSVEPQPSVYSFLEKRFHKNANFVGVNKAVGECEGVAEMFLCDSDGVSSMSQEWIAKVKEAKRVSDNYEWNKKITVPVTTLDHLIGSYGLPDFLKVDVEGFEVKVFHGLTKIVSMICFECSTPVIDNCVTIVKYLADLADYRFNFITGEESEFLFSEWKESASMVDYLRSKETGQYGDVYAKAV